MAVSLRRGALRFHVANCPLPRCAPMLWEQLFALSDGAPPWPLALSGLQWGMTVCMGRRARSNGLDRPLPAEPGRRGVTENCLWHTSAHFVGTLRRTAPNCSGAVPIRNASAHFGTAFTSAQRRNSSEHFACGCRIALCCAFRAFRARTTNRWYRHRCRCRYRDRYRYHRCRDRDLVELGFLPYSTS